MDDGLRRVCTWAQRWSRPNDGRQQVWGEINGCDAQGLVLGCDNRQTPSAVSHIVSLDVPHKALAA